MNELAIRKSSAELRDDIGRTRLGLDFLVDALEGRLTMGSIIDEAVGMLRGRPGREAPLGALIREHPGPAALITAGVIWLAIDNRKQREAQREAAERAAARRAAAKKAPAGKSGARRSGATGARKAATRRESGEES